MGAGARAGMVPPLGRPAREKPVTLPRSRVRSVIERHLVRRQCRTQRGISTADHDDIERFWLEAHPVTSIARRRELKDELLEIPRFT